MIIGICAAPVSIPLAVALGAVALAIFVSVVCCIVAVFAGIVGCIAGAVACIVMGIMAIPVAFSSAVLLIGTGLGALGFMAAMGVLLFMGVRAATNAIIRAARKRNDRRNIEKMVNANERRKWRYKEEVSSVGGEDDE